jgi:hypothetical protein
MIIDGWLNVAHVKHHINFVALGDSADGEFQRYIKCSTLQASQTLCPKSYVAKIVPG